MDLGHGGARKRALLLQDALYGGGHDDEAADYALRLGWVTIAEMHFLASKHFLARRCTCQRERVGRERAGLRPPRLCSAEPAPARPLAGGMSVRSCLVRGSPHRCLPPVQGATSSSSAPTWSSGQQRLQNVESPNQESTVMVESAVMGVMVVVVTVDAFSTMVNLNIQAYTSMKPLPCHRAIKCADQFQTL